MRDERPELVLQLEDLVYALFDGGRKREQTERVARWSRVEDDDREIHLGHQSGEEREERKMKNESTNDAFPA